jgi:hypothetical protein
MNAKKMYKYLLLIFIGGLVLSVWIVRYASSQLTSTSSELTGLRSDISGLELKREGLEKAKVVMADNAYTIERLAKVVPADKDQARVVGEIYSIADKAGVNIDSVGFPASTLGSQAVRVASPADTTTTNATASSSTSSSATATPPAPAPQKIISQATPLKDIPGVQSIELSLGAINSKSLPPASGVRYSEMLSFIRQLERNERATQITAIGIGQDKVVNGEPTFSLTVSLTIFIQS